MSAGTPPPRPTAPWVAYVDMDAYYVSCEIRDRPELAERPVIVGRFPEAPTSRGVVLSASYAARAYGVHSAQPTVQAARRCPDAVWIPPDFTKYARIAEEIRALLARWADRVVPLSIDEAALTVSMAGAPEVEAWARDVQAAVHDELRLPCSVGASPFAIVAKIACDAAKPGGVRVVDAPATEAFLRELSVQAVPGIGPKSTQRLAAIGVRSIGELGDAPAESVRRVLGRYADLVRELARGRPGPELARPPSEEGPRQRSLDRTFDHDRREREFLLAELGEMAEELAHGLAEEGLRYQSVAVRLRWSDFSQVQRGHQLGASSDGPEALRREGGRLARELLDRERRGADRAVRRLSLTAAKLSVMRGRQLPLDAIEAERPSR
jgi:nucleotidyltransferase/DNA polymerase involved in DNA repair